MALAIFDLDNTLIAGDSDHSWGEFLVEQGIVDPTSFSQANDKFYQDYVDGILDIYQYQEFALAPIANKPMAELDKLHQLFCETKIAPLVLKRAQALVEKHREAGDTLLIITATNRFVAGPICLSYGIENVLATEPEIVDGVYTGKIVDIPCFQGGKVKRLNNWLAEQSCDYDELYFYSDSANDLPLLGLVDHPIAVDPDPKLEKVANDKGWPIISLR